MTTGRTDNPIESIAIVGMSGRFPGARNVGEFWRNLENGVESIEFPSDDELRELGVSDAVLARPNYVKARSMIEGMDLFDAAFFGFNPNEARILDPQHRLFLEVAWEALEDAGYDVETYPGLVGVYGSASSSSYFLYNLFPNREVRDLVGSFQLAIGNDREFLPTRVSYKLNLTGPSVNVQTACSSSLVAVHLACQSLLHYQCDMSLAGGVSIRSSLGGYFYMEGGILSPDGHCRAFDADAQGTIFGSGVGIVVLKRLSDALRDGDTIHAVIRGSAMNNDGAGKVGYTAPGVDGQTRVIAEAQAIAGVHPDTIGYVETHGTATNLGDPIEVAALTRVFRNKTKRKNYCAIGSVKSNVGHLDAAAGITGLIKTVLALEHGKLVPSLHYKAPNPEIDFASSPFYVGTETREWETDGEPRRAGVSSFGIGGTNAHAIVESVEPRPLAKEDDGPQVLFLSARTASALETVTANLAAHLDEHPETGLADAAYTLRVGRASFPHRRMLVCKDRADAVAALAAEDPRRLRGSVQEPAERKLVFMFSGQGSQYPNMGAGLYRDEPGFRRPVDAGLEVLRKKVGLDLEPILFPGKGGEEAAAEALEETRHSQPALFLVEYALARLWMERGLSPDAMIGHSIGEYVAACLAGVFSFEDGLALVAERGRLMQGQPAGAMLSVPLSPDEVEPFLDADLSLAAVNAPSVCAVSGPFEAIEALEESLGDQGIAFRRLHTSHAFHSAMMDSILEPFTEAVRGIELQPPKIPYLSNVTGAWITDAEATDPAYWARHLRSAVRFSDGVRELAEDPARVFLEVGPGRTLASLARQHGERGASRVVLSSLRPPTEERSDAEVLLDTWGQLWLAGVTARPDRLHAGEGEYRVSLPSYPFERQRYWIEIQKESDSPRPSEPSGRSKDLADWFFLPSWKRSTPLAALLEPESLEGTRWLVFTDGCGLGSRLAGRLEERGATVVRVAAGTAYGKADGAFTLAPAHRADYLSLLDTLGTPGDEPLHVAHLWSVTDGPEAPEADLGAIQERGFGSLLALVQAIGERSPAAKVHLGVVSNHLHAVADDDRICPSKATILGPCRIAPVEYPNLTCTAVDIALSGSEEELDRLAGALISDLAARSNEGVVAYRGAHRWVQAFEPVRMTESAPGVPLLREGGVCLVTGGLGGIGLSLAKHLAEGARAKLVLVSRSSMPEREAWEEWLGSHPEEDATSRRIHEVQAIEAAGGEVLVAQADVTDRSQMAKVVAQAEERFGGVHGVIHAAGVPGGGLIQLKTADMAERVFAPKVTGTLVLDDVLAGRELDLFVLCSSVTSLLGGVGQVDYCGANAFLDAFASDRARRNGTPTVSISWDAWGEVGMAVKAAETFDRSAAPAGAREASGGNGAPVVPELTGEEDPHPLFDRVRRDDDEEIHAAAMSTDRHWVLGEHWIAGRPTLVGTAYLEMARAAFAPRAGDGGVRVEDVLFMMPLTAAEGEVREVETVLRPAGDGCSFVVRSRAGAGAWQDHATGRLRRVDRPADGAVDLAALEARCDKERIEVPRKPAKDGAEVKAGEMHFGPRWRSLTTIHVGEGEALAELELPDEFSGDLSELQLHPALLDLATSFATARLGGGGIYLPFAYQGLEVYGPMRGRLYSHVRFQEDGGAGKEALKLDVSIFDESGARLVEVAGFTMKRVNEKVMQALAAQGGKAAGAGKGNGAPADATQGRALPALRDAILPAEGVEAFRRIVTRRGLSHVIVSTRPFEQRAQRARTATKAKLLERMEKKVETAQPTHARPSVKTDFEAPRNELEEQVAAIWQRVLGIDRIGVHDDFIELGGHSLLAIQIMSQMRETFQVNLPPDVILNSPTVASLAEATLQALAEAAGDDLLAELLDEVEQMPEAAGAGAPQAGGPA